MKSDYDEVLRRIIDGLSYATLELSDDEIDRLISEFSKILIEIVQDMHGPVDGLDARCSGDQCCCGDFGDAKKLGCPDCDCDDPDYD